MVLIAQPPGVRATRDGGTWKFARGTSGTNFVMNDFAALERSLGKYVMEIVRAEIFYKMKRAESGKLAYGEGREFDVQQMHAAQDVLELRLSDRTGDRGNRLHMRFFFSEPLHLPGLLVGLGLLWKRPGEIDLPMQTQFAKQAAVRLQEYSQRADYGL
ncbi:hypothetical protein ACOACQ_17650 [Nocardioides sp. CPCC 206347]|uniref:hypothetical protein n=1 Tax=unclassified Nocardioides TaxID=2615069 RepID=UPI00361F7DB4